MIGILFVASFLLSAQAATVPYMGCKSDGQTGPVDAPKGTPKRVPIPQAAAQKLTFYRSEQSFGVLAPSGWYCFGVYGSNGDSLFIAPEPLDPKKLFSPQSGFTGPVIQLAHSFGDTSGRSEVASIVARVFPASKKFVKDVEELGLPHDPFVFTPYPRDKLTYRSRKLVEYLTPAQTDGLGTRSRLTKNATPIEGMAVLSGEAPDLFLLSVRLPQSMAQLTATIIQQVERDSAAIP